MFHGNVCVERLWCDKEEGKSKELAFTTHTFAATGAAAMSESMSASGTVSSRGLGCFVERLRFSRVCLCAAVSLALALPEASLTDAREPFRNIIVDLLSKQTRERKIII